MGKYDFFASKFSDKLWCSGTLITLQYTVYCTQYCTLRCSIYEERIVKLNGYTIINYKGRVCL